MKMYYKEIYNEMIKESSSKSYDIKEGIRNALISELEAINIYETLASSTNDEKIKTVLYDIAREEKAHIGELQTLLKELDKDYSKNLEKGKKEVEND
jgi:rubrerythrin